MIRALHTSRRAFTLLELLVVLGILLLLIGLFIGVGVNVTRNQKVSQTRGVLEALNRALDEYMIANSGNIPRFRRDDYLCVPGHDGPFGRAPNGQLLVSPNQYLNDSEIMPQRPDASVFVRQASGIGDVDAALGQLPERFLVVTSVPSGAVVGPCNEQIATSAAPSVVDAWGDPNWRGLDGALDAESVQAAWPILEQSLIYYVHPDNRRNRTPGSGTSPDFPDAQELYGSVVNSRPYFFSAGPDGFYGHPSELRLIETAYSMAQRDGEDDESYFNRVLRQARLDNLYSTPVDIEFRVSMDVIQAFLTP